MRIHKEGYTTILIVMLAFLVCLVVILSFLKDNFWIIGGFLVLSALVLIQTFSFFRIPGREIVLDDHSVIAAADGKIVMIEEVEINEYLHEKRLQVSIFMNIFNVHINWYPVKGSIIYYKYHPGDKMVAWHPKSSEKNEHTTVFLKSGKQIIGVRQIAGLIARRVVCTARTGKEVQQCSEMGIIKFGSRVDILLPLDADVKVGIGDKVRGCETLIAKIN
ncbi:MAG: phosphatidylserine decarboxylase family protein [Bacteroidales bacterium]|jgi:phosphatidylserine decarboxylase|nr:phosphatidylserine decarboxylase family protein [Bacteroidales bacterium]MDD4256925.1 phosphatidylserine decarboxylase family protein [Bacteroidales bacterium]MDD4653798.1 phosphatidylserine decarboxylase family protein [Bacteroidales bacterium]MDD4827585.1 phosphatidylserine decarboxylase family protein [Bacteroidales bacterium]